MRGLVRKLTSSVVRDKECGSILDSACVAISEGMSAIIVSAVRPDRIEHVDRQHGVIAIPVDAYRRSRAPGVFAPDAHQDRPDGAAP